MIEDFCCLGCDPVTQHLIPEEQNHEVPDAFKDCKVFLFIDSPRKVAVLGYLGILYTFGQCGS
jgi:hypothetical protein